MVMKHLKRQKVSSVFCLVKVEALDERPHTERKKLTSSEHENLVQFK